MPYTLNKLPASVKNAGWAIKIRDKETCEKPHVTVLFKGDTIARVSLRDGEYLDGRPPRQIPEEVTKCIEDEWDDLATNWDKMYPENPVPWKPRCE